MRRLAVVLVVAGTFAGPVAQWFLLWMFAHGAGAEGAGDFALAFSIAAPVFVAASLGFRNLWLTLDHQVSWKVYLRLRWVTSLAGAAVLFGAGLLLGLDPSLVGALSILKVGDAILDLYYARAQRESQLLFGAMSATAPVLTILVAAGIYVATGDPVAALATSAAARVPLLAGIVLACRGLKIHPGEEGWAGVRHLMGGAGAITVSQAASSLMAYIPVWLVAWADSRADVGAWAGAAYLLTAASLVGASAQAVLIPGLRARRDVGDVVGVRSRTSRVAAVLLGLCLVVVMVVVAFGDAVLAFVYGSGFAVGRGVLVPLALACAAVIPGSVWGSAVMVANRYNSQAMYLSAAVVVAAAAGVSLVLLGVPAMQAAAWAALAGSLVRYLGVRRAALRALRAPTPPVLALQEGKP